MSKDIRIEKKLLIFSALGAIFFAVGGILLGTLSHSQMILFDGLYSLTSVFLSLLSYAATSFIHKKDKRYPFGKDVIEPLWVIVKYFLLLILVGSTGFTSFIALFHGGRQVAMGPALGYSTAGSIACLIVYLILRKKAKGNTSALVKAESTQWFADTILSFVVLAGFGVSFLIKEVIPQWHWVLPYVDPAMVVLASLYFIRIPFKEIRSSMREVLEMHPQDELSDRISQKVDSMVDSYEMKESFVRIAKVGKTLWVEIDFVVKGSSQIKTISDQDRLREEISSFIGRLYKGNRLSISFTNARKWAV